MARLGDICKIQSGGTPSRAESAYWDNGSIPWVKISDINGKYLNNTEEYITEAGLENSSAKIFPAGTILYTIFATLGEVCILKINATTNQAIAGIQVESDLVFKDYLYYYLLSQKDTISKMGRGVAQNNINMRMLREFEIPLPPLKEQRRIAAVLDKVSGLIAKRRAQLDKLDLLVKARFVEMFGDPEENPRGYEKRKLGSLTRKISDGVHAKPEYTETGRPFLSVVNINKGIINFEGCKFVSEEAYQKMIKSTHPERGDILYTKVGATYGIPAYVDTDTEFCLYVSVCLIKPRHDEIDSKFLAISMSMPYIKRQADSRIKGIGVPDLHLNQINEFDILCPPRSEQEAFVGFVAHMDKSKLTIQQSLDKLETLKKALMQQYFG